MDLSESVTSLMLTGNHNLLAGVGSCVTTAVKKITVFL